ncbi:hypothetical protein [Pararhodobacter zhoushanensis]|uniref:Sulfotransferase family protein n=1 Tax=Pararhodobacter zhoushanensis TaxID=2479545 RepID=A0ABT3H1Q6_9RHOB|nr:hypothetical protein [Pararhodobacter zhoushanensis]MCW1933776.1 hypothetical protein [Pararhodobacter zhoushanensis]
MDMILSKTLHLGLGLIPGAELRHLLRRGKTDKFSPKFVRPGFDLLIDGFPRSANTYSYYVIQLSYPNAKIAHHIHSWQQFLFARLWGVPSILLLRDPDATVASLLTKKGGSPTLWFIDYTLTTALSAVFANRFIRSRRSNRSSSTAPQGIGTVASSGDVAG